MRIAVISDIHSNLQALQAAFAVIDAARVDAVYCLGDIVGYGANPNECLELVRSRASIILRGNHDHAVVDPVLSRYFSKSGRAASEWTRKVLTKENADYLTTLPFRADTELCTLAHASPSAPEEWQYVLSLDVAEDQFSSFTAPLCFIGHTHIPVVCGEDMRTFSFRKGVRMLINVGSVGQPRDGNPQLSFGLLDSDSWEYRNVRETYDVAAAAKAINDAGLPSVLAKRLFEGV
jgi:diadenosine tetraphosphatase ApaH/serine/threonine PP2A family protein phosphatase